MRWRGSGKNTTSGYLRLDVRYLQRTNMLAEGSYSSLNWSRNGKPFGWINLRAAHDSVTLIYRHRTSDADEWQSEEYPVRIERTPCNYGGHRAWFRCPALGCGRRVAVLYGDGFFACRHCHQLAYESQREAPYSRALERAQRILIRLGGSGSTSQPFPAKPKGMHWRTYQRFYE